MLMMTIVQSTADGKCDLETMFNLSYQTFAPGIAGGKLHCFRVAKYDFIVSCLLGGEI